jgi:signal-transduction protein with cAMP-binding, CBS, and nucleotidyltransferase domain
MDFEERLKALKRIRLLAGLPHGELEQLAKNVEVKTYNAGDELIKEGTSGSTAFFIVSGQTEVRRRLGANSSSTWRKRAASIFTRCNAT